MDRSCRPWIGLLTCLAVATLLSGCLVEPADQKVWNRWTETVEIVRTSASGEYVVVSALEPGYFYPLNDGGDCPTMLLVARTTSGVEVERRSGPFCRADEWLIDGSSEQTASPTLAPEITPTPVPT